MKFIDEVTIEISAGKGGPGCRHFRREKFVPLGGPDGGNGGNGGSVIFIADRNILTLLDFRHRPRWHAKDGAPGEASRRDGKSGDDLLVHVPVGTEIIDENTKTVIADLNQDGQEFIAAKGGRGGKGNDFFKSATNRTPEHFQPGEQGESKTVQLSLKLVADVGIIGLPNAGKSTLISRISAAKPRIADYPFTTLVPNLGVVQTRDNRSFVVADIPGLIPGAHTGKGLGTKFLKHIERTRLLIHLIDINNWNEEPSPAPLIDAYNSINTELFSFSNELKTKPQIVIINKIDTIADTERIEAAIGEFANLGVQALAISGVSGQGIRELIDLLTIQVFSQSLA
jgi:GTPase